MTQDVLLQESRERIAACRERISRLDEDSLDLLFREARTHNAWQEREVSDDQLHEIWDVMKFGATSANTLPARIVFIRSPQAKAKLGACLSPGNVDKTMKAPVTALLAHDTRFFEGFERLFPIYPAMADQWADDPEGARSFARHQGTLQGAYLILAIRAVGLDAGPMLGFDRKMVDAAFLAGTAWESNFLCNIGYGALEGILGPRFYRYGFDEACRIA
ncbi:MAG: malonic semialdehyde reductase [Alphaproteobacteria bacterium]|nr:malonic semialdehyde reductase [Alphaproteobacteria bacterium]